MVPISEFLPDYIGTGLVIHNLYQTFIIVDNQNLIIRVASPRKIKFMQRL